MTPPAKPAVKPDWQHIFGLFERAVEVPDGERQAWLDRACGGDEVVRHAVEEMLEADRRGETFIDRGIGRELPRSAAEARRIGSYRLLRQIGQGGMSTVYLAVRDDDAFQRRVVVKLVRRGMESDAILRRLRTERQILAGLDHPWVARLFDGGTTDDGLPYFVMEFVDGVQVDTYCEQHRLNVEGRLALFVKICAAVHYAHQNLVVHRDIKPSNILVTSAGEPKLLDFGIAKLLNPDLASAEIEPTATWQRVMTPSYASPEQVRGQPITTASDVYSLGVLLYKVLTGRLPRSFKGRSPSEIEQMLSETEPVRPSAAVRLPTDEAPPEADWDPEWIKGFERQLAGDLDAIVLKALRAAPSQRYDSVERFAADIERYQRGLPVAARAGTWRYRAARFVRRHRTAVTVAAALLVLVAGFVAAMVSQSARVARERDQARLERDRKEEVLALVLEIFHFSHPFVMPGEKLTVGEALERSVPVLESRLHEQPGVRAELLHASGAIRRVLGDVRLAEEQLAEALELRRELLAEDHPDAIATLIELALVRRNLGRLDDAERLALRAVELARGLVEEKGAVGNGAEPHPSLLSALNALVGVRCWQERYQAAEGPAQEALDLARRSSAPEQEMLTLEHLALIRGAAGDFREAAALYRRALAMRRERYGEQHPILKATLNNLGLNLRRAGELTAAERVYLELLELQRAHFGDDYENPTLFNNLAGLYLAHGDWAAAETWYGNALAAVLERTAADDWRVLALELGLQEARSRGGRPGEAEARLREILERWRPKLEDGHLRVVEGEGILGEALSLQGRCDEAEPLLAGSLEGLLGRARRRDQDDALERLRRHFERCGRPEEIAPFEARLEIPATR